MLGRDAADRLIGEGNRLEEAGHFREACELYRQAVAQAPRYAKAHVNLGIGLEAIGEIDGAIAAHGSALEAAPDDPYANYNLGKLLYGRGELARASGLLARALQSRPDFPEARIVLALMHVSQGRLAQAATELEAALRQRPDDFGALFHYAATLRALNRWEEARDVLKRAIAVDTNNADAHAALSEILSAQGDAAGATVELEAVLVQRPDWADALHNYGCLLTRQLRFEQAEDAFRRAITAQPKHAGAYRMLGDVLLAQRRAEEALASYDRAVAIDPDFAEALSNRAVALEEVKRYDEALASCARALALQPNFAEALFNRGNVLKGLKRYDEALASYDQALAIKPDFAEALSNRGLVLQELKRHDEALVSYDQALAVKPDFAEALSNRGLVLQELQRYDEALASYDQVLAIKPDYAEALSNRGVTLKELTRYDEALASYDQALAIKPDFAEALNNRGAALKELRRYDEALASYDKALAMMPRYAEALSNRGNALRELQRYDEALASYDQALVIKPDFAEAHFNQSMCRLLIGDFARGWEQHEWRWRSKDFLSPKRNFSQPLWLGKEDIKGKTILLHAEQGLGDTIQFARYAQAVAQRGARVVLEVHSTLRSLMSHVAGAHQVLSQGEPLPRFEFHCPLMSLPLAFNTRLQTIPATTPYLRATEAAIKMWKDRLGQRNALRVGIVWSGRRAHKNDHNRSIALNRFAALASSGATLVSLQNEVRAKDEEVLSANDQIIHFGSELKDFSDTAALVSLMDLVISVDTSVAHLAGALGKPVWILLPFAPDWRWLVNREDSPWYPTARLFRQPEIGDWHSVMGSVLRSLKDLCRSTSLDARS